MKIKLELSPDHLQIIRAALDEMPLRLALPVVQEISRQIAAQQQEPAAE